MPVEYSEELLAVSFCRELVCGWATPERHRNRELGRVVDWSAFAEQPVGMYIMSDELAGRREVQ